MDELEEPFIAVSALLFGLLLGSFANVIAYRVPRRVSIVLPGSFCTACGHAIRWYDNIPLLSFALLKGRCRDCLSPISWRYPAVEAVTGLLVAAIVVRFGVGAEAAAFVYLGLMLVVLFLTDLDFHTLPDEITVTGIGAGLLLALLAQLGLVARTTGALTFAESALGVTAGAGILLVIMFLYQTVRDRAGMGVGDVKLMAFVGAFLGLELMLVTLFLAVLLGSLGGLLFVAVRGGGLGTALPFGTYIACATIAALLYGPQLVAMFLS